MTRAIVSLLLLLLNLPLFGVQISYAKIQSTGRVAAADSVSRKRGPFECLECGEELILRRGELLSPHFAHKPDQNGMCGGGLESWQHELAKQLLSDDLHKWRFVSRCSDCDGRIGKRKIFSTESGHTAHIEDPFNRFRVDVMVKRKGVCVAAIEVCYSHAVDNQKRKYFKRQKLKILEVDADQIIEAYERESFEALLLEQESCDQCEKEQERRNRRPCLQCETWHNKSLLEEIEAPPGHNYPTAFVCDKCQEYCPDCDDVITRYQLKRYKRCYSCNQEGKHWNKKPDQARKNIEEKKFVNNDPPESIEFIAKKEEVREQLRVREQEFKLQLEQELIKQKKIQCRVLKEKAQQIVSIGTIDLAVPFHEKELAKNLGARWNGNNWYVAAKQIRTCSRWLNESQELILLVEELLKGNLKKNNSTAKRKRSDDQNIDPKKRCITDFFKPLFDTDLPKK